MKVKDKKALLKNLMRANVPLCDWGKGDCKKIAHLEQEIDEGECVLQFRNGSAYRYTKVVLLDIFYHDSETKELFHLIQKEQINQFGQPKERKHGSSVSEKLKPGEDPGEKAINRALLEELQITDTTYYKEIREPYMTLSKSKSYKGIITLSYVYPYTVLLNRDQFKPEGYTEVQNGTTTHFEWEKCVPESDNDYVVFKAVKD